MRVAARATNQDTLDEYTARNNAAMQQLISQHGAKIKKLPDQVMSALREATSQVVAEKRAADPMFDKIYRSYAEFYQGVKNYHNMTEYEHYRNRQ